METFPFIYHRLSLKHPKNSGTVQLGQGSQWVGKPSGPSQYGYTLNFPAMWWMVDTNGNPDILTDVARNAGALNDFYERHQLFEKFNFDGKIHGTIVARFASPLELPEPLEGQYGRLPPFTVELITQP